MTAALAIAAQAAPAAEAKETFPRVAGLLIGNPQNYWDSAYQQQIAGVDMVVMSVFPGWGSTGNTTMEQTVKNLKAKNPNTKIFLYVIAESFRYPVPEVWNGLQSKLDKEGWWLTPPGDLVSRILSDYGRDTFVLNITPYAKADSSGKRFNAWFAEYMANSVGQTSGPIDGLFSDNVFWKPRRDGDWNRDGKVDKASDPAVQAWFRQGYSQYIAALRAKMPGKLQIANVADWGHPNAVLTEYQGKFDGGILEGLIGKNYSVENQGWAPMMAHYRKTMAALGGQKLAMFQMDGDPKDYRTFRYGFASCLLDDGYFTFNDKSKGYSGIPQFDEYKVKLGKAVSKPSTSAWSSGVYRRDFENGIALVNPKGNGVREVTLEQDFVAIAGTQDKVVNSGKTVRKVTLQDRDGIILMRSKSVKKPAAPSGIALEPGS
jgi:hypothetical protein